MILVGPFKAICSFRLTGDEQEFAKPVGIVAVVAIQQKGVFGKKSLKIAIN